MLFKYLLTATLLVNFFRSSVCLSWYGARAMSSKMNGRTERSRIGSNSNSLPWILISPTCLYSVTRACGQCEGNCVAWEQQPRKRRTWGSTRPCSDSSRCCSPVARCSTAYPRPGRVSLPRCSRVRDPRRRGVLPRRTLAPGPSCWGRAGPCAVQYERTIAISRRRTEMSNRAIFNDLKTPERTCSGARG